MYKYSEEFKMNCVLEYINQHISPQQQKYGMRHSLMRQWIPSTNKQEILQNQPDILA